MSDSLPMDPLARVGRAAAKRRRTDLEYRAALEAARASGLSYGQLAKAAGVTPQAVQKLLKRSPAAVDAHQT